MASAIPKVRRLALYALSLVAVLAIGLFVWQRVQWARTHAALEQLRSENSALPAMRDELARLRQVKVDHEELVRLREQAAAARAELPKLRARAAEARGTEAEAAQLRAELARQAAQGSDTTQGVTAPMTQLMRAGLERMTRRRLSGMQEQLKLTPVQAAAIEEILMRRAHGIAEATQGVMSGKIDREKVASFREGRGDTESQIMAILSPEQQTAYAAFQETERRDSARLSANSELLRMQHTLGLTEDQQDRVFTALYDHALQQGKIEMDGRQPPNPAEIEQWAVDRKLKALEGILTPAQMNAYREEQEVQLKFVKAVVSRMQPREAEP